MECPYCHEEIDYILAEVGIPVNSEGVAAAEEMGSVPDVDNTYSCPACKENLVLWSDFDFEE